MAKATANSNAENPEFLRMMVKLLS
jgi:hypothetical protein